MRFGIKRKLRQIVFIWLCPVETHERLRASLCVCVLREHEFVDWMEIDFDSENISTEAQRKCVSSCDAIFSEKNE